MFVFGLRAVWRYSTVSSISSSRRRGGGCLGGEASLLTSISSVWANLAPVFSLTSALSGIHRHEGQRRKRRCLWSCKYCKWNHDVAPPLWGVSNYRRVIRLLCRVKNVQQELGRDIISTGKRTIFKKVPGVSKGMTQNRVKLNLKKYQKFNRKVGRELTRKPAVKKHFHFKVKPQSILH